MKKHGYILWGLMVIAALAVSVFAGRNMEGRDERQGAQASVPQKEKAINVTSTPLTKDSIAGAFPFDMSQIPPYEGSYADHCDTPLLRRWRGTTRKRPYVMLAGSEVSASERAPFLLWLRSWQKTTRKLRWD